MPRYFDRTRAIEKKRKEIEATTIAVILLALQGLWRLIFPRWRDDRQDEIEGAFNVWADGFTEDYEAEILSAAGEFSALESAWWQATGKPMTIDPAQVAADYAASFQSQWGKPPAQALRDSIERDIQSDLAQGRIDHLREMTLGRSRAEGIASDLATDVLGQVVMTGMRLSGTGFWVFQSMEDDLVCDQCDEQHGSVHPAIEQFRKLHKRCRCMPTPLVDWLRARDQPFQGIAEGLAARANA